MTKNMGQTDRIIRAVLGLVLLGVAFTSLHGIWAIIAGIVGVVMVGTAALGTCPPYAILGINTCKVKN